MQNNGIEFLCHSIFPHKDLNVRRKVVKFLEKMERKSLIGKVFLDLSLKHQQKMQNRLVGLRQIENWCTTEETIQADSLENRKY